MFESALGTAACIILLLSYFDLRRIAGYAVLIDIGIFGLCIWLFQGTYAGMMTGIIAGVVVSVFLKLLRRVVVPQTLQARRKEGDLAPRLRWADITLEDEK